MKEQEHFIKNIEIKNFKCFEDFKAEGFGRVNLIGGKNNVGKTAFMEACLLSDALSKGGANFHSALFTIENNRKAIKDMTESTVSKILQKNSPIQLSDASGNKVDLKFEDNNIKLSITTHEKVMSFKDVGNPELYIKLLSSFISSTSMNCNQLSVDDKLLNILYDGVKRNRKREELNTFINEFDNDLIEVDIIGNDFKIFSKSQNKWVSISDYGDGIKYYIAYLSGIWTYKNNIIFIDEIENGIHYTNLDKLWEIILTISKQQNVQVFATTHSKECIESYARVAKKLKDEEIGFIELGRNKKNELDAVVMDSEMFQRFVKLGNEVRGW